MTARTCQHSGLRGGVCEDGATCNRLGGAAFAGRDHNEQLHDRVVDLLAAALHDEDIFVAYRGLCWTSAGEVANNWRGSATNLHRRLSIGELAQGGGPAPGAEAVADAVDEGWVRRAAEDNGSAHDGGPEECQVVVVEWSDVLEAGKVPRHNYRVMSAGRRWALAGCTGPSPTRRGCKRKRSGFWQASAWARQMPDEAACLPAMGDAMGEDASAGWAGLGWAAVVGSVSAPVVPRLRRRVQTQPFTLREPLYAPPPSVLHESAASALTCHYLPMDTRPIAALALATPSIKRCTSACPPVI
jgi:hypothetical protein